MSRGGGKDAAFEFIKDNLVEKYQSLKLDALAKSNKAKTVKGQWKLTLKKDAKKLAQEAEELKELIIDAAKELGWSPKKLFDLSKELTFSPKVEKHFSVGAHVPPAKLIAPPVAIAGGIITGSVRGTDDEPAPDINVGVGTIHGVVTNVKTDESGKFESKVPVGESIIVLTAVGLEEEIKRQIVPPHKLDFPPGPPEFIQPGQQYTVEGNYPNSEYTVETYGESYLIPDARSISKNGDVAITTLTVPSTIEPGKGKWILKDIFGKTHTFKSCTYHILRAKVDQNKLTSGQKTPGQYGMNFGKEMANQKLWVKIEVSGAIKLLGQSLRPFYTDANGHAVINFRVKGKKVPPNVEIPYSISHTIYSSEH